MQKMTRLASLTVDRSASIELSFEQKTKLCRHFQVIRFSQKNRVFTNKIHATRYRLISIVKKTSFFEQKKKIETRLNCVKMIIRNRIIKKTRKRYFRKIDIIVFNFQFFVTRITQIFSSNTSFIKLITYHFPKRAVVIRLTCTHVDELTKQAKLIQRI